MGTGIARFIVFSSSDGAVTSLRIDSAWGPVFNAGADYRLSEHVGLYANATFVPLKTNARGIVNGLPVTAHAKADPTTFQFGISYRF